MKTFVLARILLFPGRNCTKCALTSPQKTQSGHIYILANKKIGPIVITGWFKASIDMLNPTMSHETGNNLHPGLPPSYHTPLTRHGIHLSLPYSLSSPVSTLEDSSKSNHCMTSLFTFGSQNGKKRGLLALFILHSLHQDPKSGYGLLKDIGEKTHGLWTPSKGTMYPLLHHMEREGLIIVETTEPRTKTIYRLTKKGEETLSQIKEQSRESHRKMTLYKNLIYDIFRSEKIRQRGLFMEIETTLENLQPGNEEQVIQILETCLNDLRKLL
jgi:DNA-binding PadR family transcriptional regulator